MMLAKEASEKLVRLPGIEAVCVTFVGSDETVPLGLTMYHPKHTDFRTAVRAISKLSDHVELLTRPILEEEDKQHVGTDNGKDGTGVGESDR